MRLQFPVVSWILRDFHKFGYAIFFEFPRRGMHVYTLQSEYLEKLDPAQLNSYATFVVS